jgi:UDP-4-amino-4,6-dideoxy-N-acetyl-beta-L-altrosamine transaminase
METTYNFMSFIPYGRQDIDQKDIDSVIRTLKSDYLTCGPAVEEFEKSFASLVGCKYTLALNNATAALHLAVKALAKDSKKKVLTTPITFAASANSVLYNKLEVDFVDIDPDSYLMDLDLLEAKLDDFPNLYQGIIPVDFAGLPIDIERLRKIANKFNLWIIEDACHAPGGGIDTSNGYEMCGSGNFSDITTFSFHPVKHIACGEGGMLCTNNEQIYSLVKLLRSHGIERSVGGDKPLWFQEMHELGFNYRMPDILASLGNSQLDKLDKSVRRRNEIALIYADSFNKMGIKSQLQNSSCTNAYHLFVIEVERRDELYNFLKSKNVGTQIHYVPVYLHPYYESLGFRRGHCPVAEAYFEKCLSLPMFPTLKDSEQRRVIELIGEFFGS